jgi:hypothetical protein
MEKCSNCASKSHSLNNCNRAPKCVSCGEESSHPSSSPSCPTFIRKSEALDERFPENSMPYFPMNESWTWALSPSNPPPLLSHFPHLSPPTHVSQTSVRFVKLHIGMAEAIHIHIRNPALSHVRLITAGPASVVKPHSRVHGVHSPCPPPPLQSTLTLTCLPQHPLNELLRPCSPTETQNLATKCA